VVSASEMHAESKKVDPTFFQYGLFSKTQNRAKNAFFCVENGISARNGKVFGKVYKTDPH
jgi:hypothetical protein